MPSVALFGSWSIRHWHEPCACSNAADDPWDRERPENEAAQKCWHRPNCRSNRDRGDGYEPDHAHPGDFVVGKSARGQATVAESSGNGYDRQPESSPEKVAHRGANLLGVSLSREGIAEWGNRVHWLYGAQWGAVYAILRLPGTPLAGAAYGAVLWLGSDELLLWALGIAEKPTHYPFESHASALAAHVVYGAVLGITLAGLESSNSHRT